MQHSLDNLAAVATGMSGVGDGATALTSPSTSVPIADKPIPANVASFLGVAEVPAWIIWRIVAKEYIEIWELVVQSWKLEAESQSSCCQSKRLKRGMITDFAMWVECYATLATLLAAAYPDKAPHLFAYL